MMTVPPAVLTHRGRPVPYITAWSTEKAPMPRVLAVPGGITVEGFPSDPAGVSWQPWHDRPGVGEPQYADVHGPRQRLAMQHLLCQVCKQPVVRDRLGWPWLLEDRRGEQGWPEREVTTHPPVCPPCQPVAAVLCRHLRGSVVAVRVGRVLTDGVYGRLYGFAGQNLTARQKMILFHGDARLRWILGAQVAATLLDVTVVAMPEPGSQAPEPREEVRR